MPTPCWSWMSRLASDWWRTEHAESITLLPLPPYAPESDPIKNVWKYLRTNKLRAVVWDTYDAIVEACHAAWQFLTDDPDRIRSIGNRDWASVSG